MGQEGETATRMLADEAATQVAPHAPPPSKGVLRADVPAGKRLGKYVVERTIGSGGMGIVCAARHEQLGEPVAIKLLHPKAAGDKIQVERFVREARATARIKSEHVVRVLDAGEEEGTNAPYIVMEYLHGKDVGRILHESGPLAVPYAADIMIQVCEAVAGAHALGIIHRDLKPSNFFVTERADRTPLVKVLDFGISKAAHADAAVDPSLTETQAVFGSPTYMSPEQIRSSKNVDARSDVWSLGVAMFEMLSAKLPFIADNVSGLLASVVADAPFRLAMFNADVPEELEAIVLACLEKDPTRRVQSAAELAARLAPFASAEGAHLAARIDRIARSSSPSVPPHARTSRPSLPPVAPLPPLSRPPTPLSSNPTSGVAFGTTGTDLSATGPDAYRRRRTATFAILGAGIFLAAVAAGIGLVALDRRSAAASAVPPPSAASGLAAALSAAPQQPPAPIVIAPTPATASASASVADPPPVSGKKGSGKGAAGGRNAHGGAPAARMEPTATGATPAVAPPTAKPPAASPTDDRF